MDVTSTAAMQRYHLAGALLSGRRVLELCPGAGHGTEHLRAHGCGGVLAVDAEPAIAVARRRIEDAGVDFLAKAPLDVVAALPATGDDVLVCIGDMDGRADHVALVEALAARAEAGWAVVMAFPDDARHAAALAVCRRLPDKLVLEQSAAEGAVLRPEAAATSSRLVARLANAEPAVDHRLVVVGLDAAGRVGEDTLLAAAIVPAGRVRQLERANQELRRANARLARGLPGRAGAAAVAVLARERAAARELERLREALQAAEQDAVAAAVARDETAARAAELAAQAAHAEERATRAEKRVEDLELRALDAEARVVEVEARAAAAETWARDLDRRLLELGARRAVRIADRVGGALRRPWRRGRP